MNTLTRARRLRGPVVALLAFALLAGPVPASDAALTSWETIGAGWAWGGSSRLLDGPENGIDVNRAHVSIGTNTAIDPRRIRIVASVGKEAQASHISWWIECIDENHNYWSKSGFYDAPELPFRRPVYRADMDGPVQACAVTVDVTGPWEELPYRLRVKAQARYAGM